MWVVFPFYLLFAYSEFTGRGQAAGSNATTMEPPWSWVIAAISLGIFALTVKGFAE